MPHKCAKTAQEMEKLIFPKFCLTDQPLNDNGLSLTPKRLEENEEARKVNGPLTFNSSIRIEESPEEPSRHQEQSAKTQQEEDACPEELRGGQRRPSILKGQGERKKSEQTRRVVGYGMEREMNKM